MISKIALSGAVGGGYDEFWNSKKRYRVLKGGKASKKSATTALNLIYRLIKYPESNILVVRAVMNTHRDSTFAQLKWAQEKLGVAHLFKNNISPLEMTYIPTNQKIIFRGFDDVLKLAGATVEKGYLNFVWVDEAFDRFIPLIVGVLGAGLNIWINMQVSAEVILAGLVSGLASTGLYEAFHQFIHK